MRSLLITLAVATAAIAPAVRLVGTQGTVTIARGWACSTAVSAGDSSTRCLRAETREVDGMNSGKPSGAHPMATLSRAAGTPAEGAETT